MNNINKNITRQQILELRKHAKSNFLILTKNWKPLLWPEGYTYTGLPIIYGNIYYALSDFQKTDSGTIISVDEYCRRFNKKVEDIMDYHPFNLHNNISMAR